jgi:hypothetical protein
MNIDYKGVSDICAKHGLGLIDFTALQLMNSWHNQVYDLEETVGKLQEEARECQLPFTFEVDKLGLNRAMVQLAFNREYARDMLGFYHSKVLADEKTERKEKLTDKLRRWLYYASIF